MADETSYIHEHLATLNYLVKHSGANNIVEIGTGNGDSTLAMADACAVAGRGHVTSLDIMEKPKAYDLLFDSFWLNSYVTFMRMDSLKYLDVIDTEIDFLFIDGLHTEKQVTKELEGYRPLISDGGVIVLHDTNNPAHTGVKKAVQNFLSKDTDRIIQWTMFEWYNCNGLTILELDIGEG